MRWNRDSDSSLLHQAGDYTDFLRDKLNHVQIRKANIRYPSEAEIQSLWRGHIESGRMQQHVWTVHYILAKKKFETLRVNTRLKLIFDEFTGSELKYHDLHDYLYGPMARDEIQEYIKVTET